MESSADLTSIIVVAADSGDDLSVCVERALASMMPVEVIVSDNASRDGSIETLRDRWPDEPHLRILRNGGNLGFGAGCNRAAAVARGDALLFLNPDCRIESDTIARLRAHLDGSVGLLGAAIVDVDGRPEPASRRRDPLIRRALTTAIGLARWESIWPALAGTNLPLRDNLPMLENLQAVSGALMLMPRAVFERVHGFDQGYFLHFEDMDLCRRVRDAGLRVACANDVHVVHVKGTSSRTRPFFVASCKHRGMWRWYVKFDPAARNPLKRALVWCGIWMHFALLTPRYAWQWGHARLSDSD